MSTMRMHSDAFMPLVLGGIENGEGHVFVAYLPADFDTEDGPAREADRLLVDGNMFNAFTRSADFPTPAGQVAWRCDETADVGRFQAFVYED